jgi:hypothetical protein
MLSVCVCVSAPIQLSMAEPVFMKLSIYTIVAREPISTAYIINPSHQSLCLYVYPLIVARQQLGINFFVLSQSRHHNYQNLKTKLNSELLYDWRFTAKQFVLASSPFRFTTRFFQLNSCGNSPYVTSSLKRR